MTKARKYPVGSRVLEKPYDLDSLEKPLEGVVLYASQGFRVIRRLTQPRYRYERRTIVVLPLKEIMPDTPETREIFADTIKAYQQIEEAGDKLEDARDKLEKEFQQKLKAIQPR